MDPTQLRQVRESYARCCLLGLDFFDTFYELFLFSSGEVAKAFARTDLGRQKEMLRDSLSLVLAYAQGQQYALGSMERLAQVHARAGQNIPPRLYGLWTNCLISALWRHDPQFGPELEAGWRAAVAPALDLLGSRYEGGGPALKR